MRYLKIAAFVAVMALMAGAGASTASAQVRVGVGIGLGAPVPPAAYVAAEPACAYGYYSYYPYACAPYGYWGPNYFVDGVFIGAGPWFHGWGWHPGPGYYRGFAPGYRGPAFHGPVGPAVRGGPAFHAPASAFHGNVGGGFHAGGSFHAGGGFHGGHR